MNADAQDEARRAVERVARAAYGRLLAYLTARCRDLAAAEDALSDALVAALRTWPRDGVPAQPEAWLLTAARNALTDAVRHQRVVAASEPALLLLHGSAPAPAAFEFPDERLKLLFVCTHPAIDSALRAPLMLQTVLGLDAAAIAQAFLVSPAAMGQRLVRAKARIRDEGLRFEVPGSEDLPQRLEAVLEAVYAAFGLGWDALQGGNDQGPKLADEAIWIGRDLLRLLPDEPEVAGLLALMLYCHARRPARRSAGGAYLPLSQQEAHRWDQPLIAEAESLLARAAARRRPGRFQWEAAIQSAHVERARTGLTDWAAIAGFYEQIVRLAPSIGACTAHAAAVAEASGPAAGLAQLDTLDPKVAASYQPYWALRGHVLQQLGRGNEARTAYDLAVSLSPDPAVRDHLLSKSRALARRGW